MKKVSEEGPNGGKRTPTTSVNNKGKKRDIVLANDGKEIVGSAKKARTSPPTPHPAPETSSLNATGAVVMSDRDKRQDLTRKRPSQPETTDNMADAAVHPSKKVKTSKLNEPRPLLRTGIPLSSY